MSNPFVAEIRIVGFTFAPKGWATCDGQLMPISQNTALFSLLGTTYGGDGKTTFALPNLQGNAPLGAGQGQGLSLYDLGETGGGSTVTLLSTEMPVHTHSPMAQATVPVPTPVLSPAANVWAVAGSRRATVSMYASSAAAPTRLSDVALPAAGTGQPHNNMPPYLCLLFIIALQGIYPPRS